MFGLTGNKFVSNSEQPWGNDAYIDVITPNESYEKEKFEVWGHTYGDMKKGIQRIQSEGTSDMGFDSLSKSLSTLSDKNRIIKLEHIYAKRAFSRMKEHCHIKLICPKNCDCTKCRMENQFTISFDNEKGSVGFLYIQKEKLLNFIKIVGLIQERKTKFVDEWNMVFKRLHKWDEGKTKDSLNLKNKKVFETLKVLKKVGAGAMKFRLLIQNVLQNFELA